MRVAHQNIGGGRQTPGAKRGARRAMRRLLATNAAVICINEGKNIQRRRLRYRTYGTRDVGILVRRDLKVHDARVTEVSPPVPTIHNRGWGHGRPAAIVTLTGPRIGRVTVICTHLTPSRDREGHAARAAGVNTLLELVDRYAAQGPVIVAADTNGTPTALPKLHDALVWNVAGKHRIDWIGWTRQLRAVRVRNLGLNGSDHPARIIRLARR